MKTTTNTIIYFARIKTVNLQNRSILTKYPNLSQRQIDAKGKPMTGPILLVDSANYEKIGLAILSDGYIESLIKTENSISY